MCKGKLAGLVSGAISPALVVLLVSPFVYLGFGNLVIEEIFRSCVLG